MALSTYLPLRDIAGQRSVRRRTATSPILMCHGLRDAHACPRRWARRRAMLLQSLGYPVEWQSYPMEHQVCMEEVRRHLEVAASAPGAEPSERQAA